MNAILAVCRRNLTSYFSGVLGYLFIVVFVTAGALFAFRPEFFTNNAANLDPLSEWFPMLLLFIVPAVTMASWADERKLATDELLFTLPASDVAVLLGKFLAVAAVYTVALLFSLTHVAVLAFVGDPDAGVLLATYLGYWLAGIALVSAGMFASSLTSSATVAFLLGAGICAIPVFVGRLPVAGDVVQALSLPEQLRDFTLGMIPLSGLFYFLTLTAFFLYLNLVTVSRRHWSARRDSAMGLQFAVRIVSLAVVLVSLNVIGAKLPWRLDLTSEGLYTVAQTTEDVISRIDEKRPVTIQAYVSPEMPRDHAAVRKQLLGLLRQLDRLGGGKVEVRVVDVEPNSEQAEEAEALGIKPVQTMVERDGRRSQADLFMGVVVTSPLDEVVVPFLWPGTPIEYELTRSIGTVSNEKRLTVGILDPDVGLMRGENQDWQIVRELRQQYKVLEVPANEAIDPKKYDVVVAVMPSGLTDPQMTHFVEYVKSGRPVLVFDDPFPISLSSPYGLSTAPRMPKPAPNMGGMFGMRPPPPEPKHAQGKATALLDALGIAWNHEQIAWDSRNPHPEFSGLVNPELIFMTPKNGVADAVSQESRVTRGLQEVVALYSGTLRPVKGAKTKFQPLLRTSLESGLLDWEQFTEGGFDITRMAEAVHPKARPRRVPDDEAHVVAAHVTADAADYKRNAIYVADLDLVSNMFFELRARPVSNLNLDNVTFVLDAVDVLAGDDRYVDLRKRRAKARPLEYVEHRTAEFVKERNDETEAAEKEAQSALDKAKKDLEEMVSKIRDDQSLSPAEKQSRLENAQETEQRRFTVAKANIEQEKQRKQERIKARLDRQIREAERRVMWGAVAVAPLPAFLLGVVVLLVRSVGENAGASPDRMRR